MAIKKNTQISYLVIGLTFLFLFPFYLWAPGYPQIADIFFVGFAALLFPRILLSRASFSKDPAFWLALFAGLTFIINLMHYSFLPDIRFLLSSAFYVYNMAVFLFFRYMVRNTDEHYFSFILKFLLFLVVFQFAFSGLALGPRSTGTFINPNQLAYWSLLISCLALILAPNREFGIVQLTILTMASVLVVLSVSRTGLITMGILLLVAMLFMKVGRRTKIAISIVGLFFVFLAPLGITALLQSNALDYFTLFESRFKAQSDIEKALWINRGFERFVNQPHWFLIGAGEGGFARFSTTNKPNQIEVHSGVGTLFYSYGILGGAFFTIFYLMLMRRATIVGIAILGILFIYNISHQAIRFSMFWVVLGAIAGMQEREVRTSIKHQLLQSLPLNRFKMRTKTRARRLHAPASK